MAICLFAMMEKGRFEPPKTLPSDLQPNSSLPIDAYRNLLKHISPENTRQHVCLTAILSLEKFSDKKA
jgi:hypothetical protein